MQKIDEVKIDEVPSEIPSEIPSKPKVFTSSEELIAAVPHDNFRLYEIGLLQSSETSEEMMDKLIIPLITDYCLSSEKYVKQNWHVAANEIYCDYCYYNGCVEHDKCSDRSIQLSSHRCSCKKHEKKEILNLDKNWCGQCQCPISSYKYTLNKVCVKCNVIGIFFPEHNTCLLCTPENTCPCGKEVIPTTPKYFDCPGKNRVARTSMYHPINIDTKDLSFCQFCYENKCWQRYEKDYIDGKITIPENIHKRHQPTGVKYQEITAKDENGKDVQLFAMVPDIPKESEKIEDRKVTIPIVNTNKHKIEVDINSELILNENPVYGYTCDCYYHKEEKVEPKLKYCGQCSDGKRYLRECRNCNYFACNIDTEYYCHFCASELDICPCGNKILKFEYEDVPDVKVARIHLSMDYLLSVPEVMESELLKAFPDYYELYLNNQYEKFHDKKHFIERVMKLKVLHDEYFKSSGKEDKDSNYNNKEKVYPKVISRRVIYDNYTEIYITGYKKTKYEKNGNTRPSKVLEIRKVLLNEQTEVDFWIFTNDKRYEHLRTFMTDGNNFLLNKIVDTVNGNRNYVKYGTYSSYLKFNINKNKNEEGIYEQNIDVPDIYLDYFKSIISLIQEKNIIKTNFPNHLFQISKLDNDFGPAVLEENVQALVVSDETGNQGEILNQLRKEKNLTPVKIVIVPMVLAHDGNRISTTRIKNSEIDIDGNVSSID